MRIQALICFFLVGAPAQFAFADCANVPDRKVTIIISECRALNPETDSKLKDYRGMTFGKSRKLFMDRYYKGAVLKGRMKSEKNLPPSDPEVSYIFPTTDPNPCAKFPKGSSNEFMLTQTCCDSGEWGKCIYGGSFLYRIGSKPINSFQ